MFATPPGEAINYPGFGYLYFATTLKVTTAGCPAGQYRLAVRRQWGKAFTLTPAACASPITNGPTSSLDVTGTISGLPAAKGVFRSTAGSGDDGLTFTVGADGTATPRLAGRSGLAVRSVSCNVSPNDVTGVWGAECVISASSMVALVPLLDLPSLESAPVVWMQAPP